MRIFENQKGISNLIATLILIAIAVVGGAFAFTAFRNQAQSTTTNAALQVQSLNAVNVDGTTHLSTTVKNVGTQQLTSVTIEVQPGTTGNSMTVGDLDPGQTSSTAMENDTALNAGQEYVAQINAGTPGGSITKTMTVRVES